MFAEVPMTQSHSTIISAHRYRNAPYAIEWLCRVLGFERHAVYEDPNATIGHAELTLGDGMIMLGTVKDDEYGRGFKTPAELGGVETRGIYIAVPDADAAYARAMEVGAQVVRPLQNTDYGSREFTVRDPEGYSWSLGTYDPWKARE